MDNIIKEAFTITLSYESTINVDTGEVLETRLVSRDVSKSDKPKATKKKVAIVEEGLEPKVFLEENKLRFTSAAIKLMEIDASQEVKLDVKYDNDIPVVSTDEIFGTHNGNKLSKTNTIAYRGNKNKELSKYGNEFTLIPHSTKPGLFIMDSGKEIEKPVIDENINIEEEETELPFDLDLHEIIKDEDAEITEIDPNFFKL